MESVGGSATSISLSGDEEVLPVAPTPPVVVELLKNAIVDEGERRPKLVSLAEAQTVPCYTRFRSFKHHMSRQVEPNREPREIQNGSRLVSETNTP